MGDGFVLFSVCSGHLEIVKLLTSRNADVACRDKWGYTPLHVAAINGHIDVVKYLLRLGAEVRFRCVLSDKGTKFCFWRQTKGTLKITY